MTQLAWPLQIVAHPAGGTAYAEVQTDSDAEVVRAAGLAAQTRLGQLEWAPTFGTPTGLASTDPDEFAALLEQTLRAVEPRLPDDFTVRAAEQSDTAPREVHLTAGITSIPVKL